MANKKGDTTRIQAVPDVNKCTNLGCYSMKEREWCDLFLDAGF